MTTMPRPLEHPLLTAARVMGRALDETAGVDPAYLSVAEKQELLTELTRSMSRLAGLRADVLAVAGEVAAEAGARSVEVWLAGETRTSRHEAVRDERVGVAWRSRWTRAGEAVASGDVTWEQVDVLVRALDALPADLDPELVVEAEARLVAYAGRFGPPDLARLGRRVLEVVAPEVAERAEERALRTEEQRARAVTRVAFRPRGDGATDLYACLPDHVASRLRTYLDAFTSPRREGSLGDVDRLTLLRRRGEAFCALLEHVPAHGLPVHGGTATSVMVMVDLAALRARLGLAETSAGDVLTVAEVRRLACGAGILPVVLGGRGEILDLGRTRRLFSPAQRKALAIRDRRCRAEDCDLPAAWCEAHHADRPWSRGGGTDLSHGVLLCSFHHHRAHDHRWQTSRLPNGDVRYIRRT